MPALLGNRGLFCVVGILRGWACLCRDCWFRGSGKASCTASEDCLPRFGATDPDHRGNEFKGCARRADFSGISLNMLLTAETGKKIQLKVASEKQGLCWPQTLSVLARKLIFCLSSLLPMVQALSPVVTGWQPGASSSRPISKKGCHCPNIPRVGHIPLWIHDWQELVVSAGGGVRFLCGLWAVWGSDGDLNRNLSTIWKGAGEKNAGWVTTNVQERGHTLGLHIHLHPDSFRYTVRTNKMLYEAYIGDASFRSFNAYLK